MGQILAEQRAAREVLTTTLDTLIAISPQSLVRTEVLGRTLDFRDGIEVFERSLRLFRSLRHLNLDDVPQNTLNTLTQQAKKALETFQKIQSFDPSGQNSPATARDGLINGLAGEYTTQFQHVAPVIAYAISTGTDFGLLEQEGRATVEETARLRADVETQGAAIVADAQAALAQVRRAAAEVGVAQHAIHFRREADKYLARSRWWLSVTAILAGLTLAYGLWCVAYYREEAGNLALPQSIQLAIAKILVFSVLYFVVVWAGRIYKAQWHNHVVNQHRQNALSTFETFVKAAGDEQTKNAVLLQATQSIFSPQSTGFVTQDGESYSSPQVLEIVRSIAGPKGPTSG